MRKYDLIKGFFDETSKEIVRSPEVWQSFLSAACRNYRLRFDEQVLVYAQRPDATAVLEFEKWNNHFGRWINSGAKGIAVFVSLDGEKQTLKYYFDISDTHEGRNARAVPIWEYNAAYADSVIETLEATFGELERKDTVSDAIFSAAKNAVDDNLQDYLSDLLDSKENSFLEELDDGAVETFYRNTVENSIAYMLLSRLGYDTRDFFDREDFAQVVNFNTPDTLSALGLATSEISEMALNEVSKTVISLSKENRIIDEKESDEYNGIVIKTERSSDYERSNLSSGRQLSDSELGASREKRPSAREIFGASQEVSQGTSPSEIHQPTDAVPAGRAFSGRTDKSDRDEGKTHQGDVGSGRADGGTESQGYDDLGTGHEQPKEPRGGDSSQRSGLSVTEEELPPLTDEKLILALLQNSDDSLKHRKVFLVEQWNKLNNIDKKGRYASTVYGGLWRELEVDGTTVGCQHRTEGLYFYEGQYKTRTKESLFSWNLVAEIMDDLIKSGKYYSEPELPAEEETVEESPQVSFFDTPSFPTQQENDAPEQESLFADFGISQQIIDEALCIGANDRNSTLDVAMFFRRDRGTAYNADFLKSHYGTNGAGFFFNGEQISVWYDENGINIAKGETAQKASATHLTWEQAAKRIRELLDLGRYMPQYQLDKVDEHELSFLAERIVTFYRDMDKDSKERCFPSLTDPLEGVYGYPDEVEIVKGVIADLDTFDDLNNDYIEFMDDLKRGNVHGIYRYAFQYSPEYVYEIMQGMSLEKVPFKAQAGFNPDRQYFFTNDEINKLLRRGSGHSETRFRVYTFFANHSDMQERTKMIKDQYGLGGFAAGNDNANYDGKGLFFSHGNGLEPYAKVLLKWNEVVKRIDALIKAGKYISDEDIAKLPKIEKEHIANDVERFFEVMPDEYAKPYSNELEPYRRKNVIMAQLDNPQALEDIDRMMSDALALMDKSNERDYKWHQEQYDRFVSFKNGEYHPYAVPEQKAPLPRPTKFSQPAEKENEQDKELDAVYDLLNACKIDDLTVDFENGEIVARDSDSEWRGAELYYFLLDEVLSFDIYGNLMEGYSIDESIINSVKEYAKKYNVVPLVVKNSTSIRRQFELKEAKSDSSILYKQREAFEVIGEDARTVAFELQTRLGETTYPDKTQQFVPETYIEAERLEYVANKLIENGHQVIIADDETALPAQEYFAQINEPPIWKSYKQLDEQYPDTLLFMRLGDFYEVMGENAKVVAKELDLVLTGRTINNETGERTPMVGVPVHNIDLYISRLVAKGYKVAIAENKDVNRVVAPGKTQELSTVERAKQLINDYRHEEFGYEDSADFSDLSNVSLAHTET